MNNMRICVLVSGGGSNFQSIIDSIKNETIKDAKIIQLISSNPSAYAIQRAKDNDIPIKVISKAEFTNLEERMDETLKAVEKSNPDLIVLAGFMSILPEKIIKKFKGKIINIHPSLLPKYGGKDHYGIKVHQKVIEACEKESGATVHFVDEGVDTGEIILQESVEVKNGDTPEELRDRVLEVEHKILPMAINIFQDRREKI